MIPNWLDASKAIEFGIALADQLAAPARSAPLDRVTTKGPTPVEALQDLLARGDHGVRAADLNFFKRAKLANSFKWRLIENGVERAIADEVTQTLVLSLSLKRSDQSPADQNDSARRNCSTDDSVGQLLARGITSMERGAYAEAIAAFQRLLETDPHHAIALNNLGAAHSKQSQYKQAEKYFRAAIKERPDFTEAFSNLGMVTRWRGYFEDSEKSLRSALQLDRGHFDARVNLGMTLALLNRFHEARGHFKKVLKARPLNTEALFGMAQIASMEGRFDEAEKILKRVLQINPKMPAAWAALSGLRKMAPSDDAWLQSAEALAASVIAPMEAATLRFAMGKYHDDLGQFAQAFEHFRNANELLKPIADVYDRASRTTFVDDQIHLYSRKKIAAAASGACASMKPVFVVGMMRSGTSLTEQIIASHPIAKGAGELEYWSSVTRDHWDAIKHELFLIDEPTKKIVAESYLRTLERVSGEALRIVDKAPINSEYLGVIHSVFPNARIIYMKRDPIDICLSCYFQNFSLAQSFTLDLADIVHYYQQHHRLINHWRTILPPGTILDVPYEELVADQEGWTRRILDFIDLDWDPRCLDFQLTDRPIMTASFWQARQKIFNTSVQRWRNYEEFVEPLLALKKLRC